MCIQAARCFDRLRALGIRGHLPIQSSTRSTEFSSYWTLSFDLLPKMCLNDVQSYYSCFLSFFSHWGAYTTANSPSRSHIVRVSYITTSTVFSPMPLYWNQTTITAAQATMTHQLLLNLEDVPHLPTSSTYGHCKVRVGNGCLRGFYKDLHLGTTRYLPRV